MIFLFMTLLIFTKSFTVEYIVPRKPASVDVADIDLDDDLDIVLGHHYYNNWTGISILINGGNGVFTLVDTFYYGGSHSSIILEKINNNSEYDIITQYYDDIANSGLGIIFDYDDGLYYDNFYLLSEGIGMLETTDIGTDIDIDLIFASDYGQFMGILYNNGTGQFSNPEYYDLDYHPGGLACGDLNGDGGEDILVCGGAYIDVWYNYSTGLQYCNISDTAYVSRIEIADIDQDEDNDIIATRWGMPGVQKRLFIYSNDGAGNFNLSYDKWIDEAMAEIFVSDLNNDNYSDVIYNVSYSSPNSNYELFHTYILFNNQDGTFQDPVNYYTGICSHKSYSADLDGNGWNDIITLNYDFYNPPPDTGSIHRVRYL